MRLIRLTLTFCLLAMAVLFMTGSSLVQVSAEPSETPAPVPVTFEDRLTVMSDITELDFGKTSIRRWADVAPFLRQLPGLTKCDIYNTYIRPAQAHALAAEFPQITFGWTFRLGGNGCLHVLRTDATAFSTMHHVDAYGHDSDEFSVLKYCKQIQAIDLGHNRVTDISWLAEIPQVKVLILAVNEIEDISPLAALTELEYLELFNNGITDISALTGLEKLRDLNIGFNRIEDYTPLLTLPSLERLWLFAAGNRRSPVAEEVITALLDANPNLLLDNQSTPAQGGWRQHPRYTVVRTIFSEQSYIPFED